MLKDYYQILGIPETATYDEIKAAYHTQALKWHPDKNPDRDTTETMKDINEAYSILSNSQSRMRYDKEYQAFHKTYSSANATSPDTHKHEEYDIKDDKLRKDVEKARKAAEDFVREFYRSFKEDAAFAAKGAWAGAKTYILGGLILAALGLIIRLASAKSTDSSAISDPVVVRPELVANNPEPELGWTTFSGKNAFVISIPPSLELQKENDPYTQSLKAINYTTNDNLIIFQQRGLSQREEEAYKKYCRIMIQYLTGARGDFMKSTETDPLTYEWREIFDEIVDSAIGTAARLMGNYTYKWVLVNGAYCIQIDYRRTGANYDTNIPVICRIAIFQNDNKMVKIIFAYRENEADLWRDDLNRVLNSFKWQ